MYTIRLFKILPLFTCITILKAQVIITEIMYNLEGSDSPNEFVELYNRSAFDSVNLQGWSLHDKYDADMIVDSGYGYKLPPGSYGVILEGDYLVDTGIYADIIPPGALVMKVDDNSIGNGLSDRDSLYLRNTSGETVDSLGWDVSPKPGYSLERVRLHRPSTPANWKTSRDSLGTPGKVNSVQPLEIDGHLLADSLRLSQDQLTKTELILLSGAVVNEGLNPISGEILVSEGINTLSSASIGPLAELDTASFSLDLGPFPVSGIHLLAVHLKINGDADPSNNNADLTLAVQYDWNTLHLNEFMAQPNNDQIEFIELVSQSNFTMESWSISDNSYNPKPLPTVEIKAGDYLIIAPDSSLVSIVPDSAHYLVPLDPFPILNNSGDGIYIYDLTGTVIDSLVYTTHGWPVFPEVSTEKLWPGFTSNDPLNWKSATESIRMTPGSPNSVLLFETDGALVAEISYHTPIYPEESEDFTLTLGILNVGLTSFQGTVTITEQGIQLGEESTSPVKTGDTTWVALQLQGLSAGTHILDINLLIPGDSNLINNSYRDSIQVRYPFGSVRFNEFLPIPANTQTEFVELQSDLMVPLERWAISDESGNRVTLPDLIIQPTVYPVIAADSSLLPMVGLNTPYIIPQRGFPTLNNTGDGLFLYDMTGKIIDSLEYNQNWPILAGRSTEKFRPEYISNDSSRWGLAVNPEGATPGKQNSIYYDAISKEGALRLDPNPFSPDNDGVEDQLFLKYKLPFEQGVVRVEIFDVTGRNIANPFWDFVILQEGVLVWDGKRANGEVARIGIYVIKFSTHSLLTNKKWETVQTVVLAKRLK